MSSHRSILTILTALILSTATPAQAKPQWVRVSFVDRDTTTKIGIAWTTLTGQPEAQVEYGTASGAYTKSASGGAPVNAGADLGSVSEVVLTGLAPSTVYYYRVGGPQGGWSAESTFITGPPLHAQCGKFRFVFVGDTRAESWEGDNGASVKWPAISQKALSYNPLFFLHGGDIVYDGKNAKQWAHHLGATEPVSQRVPIMYAIGNHDDGPGTGDTANYNKVLQLPRSDKALGGSGTEDYYAFEVGNAIFIAISTVGFTGGSPKFKDQADWMDKVLAASDKRWKIVFLHHPIYTEYLFLNHPPNEVDQNEALVAVFNKHHVDLVFGSHNHFYERFISSRCADPKSTVPCPVSPDQGTVYMTSGGGGAFPIFVPGLTNTVRLATSGAHHFILLDVDHHSLKLQVLDENGATLDNHELKKTAPQPDPCLGPIPTDAGPPPKDGGPPPDGAPPKQDASPPKQDAAPPQQDTALPPDSGNDGGSDDGCDCAATPAPGSAPWPIALLLGALLARRRRR